MKSILLRLNLYIGMGLLALATFILMLGSPFMKTWFYIFAWWPFILIIDSLNFRKSNSSLLSESVKDFFFTAFFSVFIWLIFELFNLRLKNWSYHNLPLSFPERWLGYFLAFASVVPILRELSQFFKHSLRQKKLALFQVKITPSLLKICYFLGAAFIVLTLVWPKLFFPLVWLGFIFLIEPINYRLNIPSLLNDFEQKDWINFWSWILAGLTTGLLWEFFNFWSGSHWEYSLPYFNFGKVFQMPFMGYFGFLPFALEVFAIFSLLSYFHKKFAHKIILKSTIYVFFLLLNFTIFYLIDIFTVT